MKPTVRNCHTIWWFKFHIILDAKTKHLRQECLSTVWLMNSQGDQEAVQFSCGLQIRKQRLINFVLLI